MSKTLKATLMGIGLSMAAIFAAPVDAQASDYCREYTRTVYIGGRTQDAYGQACLQSDGSWMIVGEGLGNDIPVNASNVNYVIHDNYRTITPTRVVYYERSPHYRRYRNAAPVFVWSYNNGGYHRGGQYVSYKKYDNDRRRYDWRDDRYDRRDRHDRDDHHDRGRGRGHDRD